MASECLGNRGLDRRGAPNLKRPINPESSEPTKPQGHVRRIYGGSWTPTCAVQSSEPPGRIFKFDIYECNYILWLLLLIPTDKTKPNREQK